MAEWAAVLHFGDWAGHREYPVTVVGETPKKWRVRVEAVSFRMPNRRVVSPGDVVLVPKYAITPERSNGHVQSTDRGPT